MFTLRIFTGSFVIFLLLCANFSGVNLTERGQDARDHDSQRQDLHVLHKPDFWNYFENEVRSKTWYCNLNSEVLLSTLEKDAELYVDGVMLRKRRQGALKWVQNDTLWVDTVLSACKELSDGAAGPSSNELQKLHMLEALSDFVEHLNYFYKVALEMETKGQSVTTFPSRIHDIDKLDPVMLVAYSERFEDMVSTSVWNLCVERHTRVNPHHQAHCVWRDCCRDPSCAGVRSAALREMVCDKVSRRLQKDLGGQVGVGMWDVDLAFFEGLPADWLLKAKELMHTLKGTD